MIKTGRFFIIFSITSLILYFIKQLILASEDIYEIDGIIPQTIGIFAALSPFLILIGIGLKLNKKKSYYFISLIITSAIYFLVFIVSIFLLWDLCLWTNNGIIYENKNNKNKMIISRDYGCGAVDSSPPVFRNFLLIDFSPFLKIITRVDTSNLNTDKWNRVNASFNIWRDGYVNGLYISPEIFS